MTDELWLVPYLDIKQSFEIAMIAAGIDHDVVSEILDTVEDAVTNNLGDD